MSKILKMSIALVIIAIGFLLLGTEVKAVEVNSKSALFQALDTQSQTVTDTKITLTADIETDIVDFCEYDWVLDLNGHTLTVIEFYVNDGSLTINDTKGNGKLNASYSMICEGAKTVINNGIFRHGTTANLIDNSGTLTINNGTFHSIWNFGNLTINNGKFANISSDEGTVKINGGTFTSYKLKEELEDGTIGECDFISMFNVKNSSIDITGGEFKADGIKEALRIYGNNEYDVNENSINDLMDKGYLAEYKLNEVNCTSWEISYNSVKVIKDESETVLKKIAPNGVWTINGAKPNGAEPVFESESLLTTLANNMDLPKGYEIQAWCNGGDNINTESVHINVLYNGVILLEKDVKAKWNEPSKEIADSVKLIINKIDDKIDDVYLEETGFILEDLYLINYLNVEDEKINDNLALNFAKDLIELTNGSNMSYEFDFRCGNSGNGLHSALGGNVVVYYNDVPVDTTKIALNYVNVIYVPKDTADSDKARIAAALKRITDYLGTNNEISMTTGGTLESITDGDYHWNEHKFFDETTSGTNYYNLTINGRTYKFVICKKDVSQLETPKYVGTDVLSNISITSDNTTIPLDTAVTVKKVENDTIKNALNTNVYAAYDITLYSNAKQAKVEKLEGGMFKVSVPIPEELKDIENLTVYYINSKGEKEEHYATVNDGIATFETNHFSTYVLAERIVETYKVLLDANEGLFKDGKTLIIDKWINGMEEKLEIPTREGYKFSGFFTEKTGGTKLENYIAEAGIDENLTFYAQWEENSSKTEPPLEEGDFNLSDSNSTNGNNPQTSDNILFFVGVFIVAIIGLIITKKFRKNSKIK